MNRDLRSLVSLVVLVGLLAPPLAGCQQESKSGYERYIPPAESAKTQVARVMDDWVEGLSPAKTGWTNPEVHVVDQTRRADQKLVRYEILGEVPAENARAFDVRVTYEGKDETEVVRYIAIGVDPMWIFRREDYDAIWQHDMEPPPDRVGEAAKSP